MLSKFLDCSINANFNYSESNLAIPEFGNSTINCFVKRDFGRLTMGLSEHVSEIDNFTVVPNTWAISAVGGNWQGNSIASGVNLNLKSQGDFLTEINALHCF